MTTTAQAPSPSPGALRTVTVVCSASSPLSTERLQTALTARTAGGDVAWDVTATPHIQTGFIPAIAVCDAASVRAITRQWPECAVLAVVPACDDGTAVVAALHAGAATCIRGDSPALAAAFIVAIARRAGLIPEDHR